MTTKSGAYSCVSHKASDSTLGKQEKAKQRRDLRHNPRRKASPSLLIEDDRLIWTVGLDTWAKSCHESLFWKVVAGDEASGGPLQIELSGRRDDRLRN